MTDITTETISTRSLLRVTYVYVDGTVRVENVDTGVLWVLPISELTHQGIGFLHRGDTVEMRLTLPRRDDPIIDTLGVTLNELSEAVREL